MTTEITARDKLMLYVVGMIWGLSRWTSAPSTPKA